MSKILYVNFRTVRAAITMEQVLQKYGLLDRFKKGKDSLIQAVLDNLREGRHRFPAAPKRKERRRKEKGG